MKKGLLFTILFLFQLNLSAQNAPKAQNTEGVVTFEEKINLHRRLEDNAVKAMIPEFRTSQMQLFFKGEECLYKAVEDDDDEETGGNTKVVMKRPQSEIYRNFATNKRIEQRDFMGKKYLIEDSIKVRAWKITGESKKILGYNCLKATFNDTTSRKQNIVVWFTDAIPLAAGPATFGTLPGLILEVNINDSETVMLAQKVEFKALKANDFKVPTKGEKISEEDFNKKMEEFIKQNGGRKTRIIRG